METATPPPMPSCRIIGQEAKRDGEWKPEAGEREEHHHLGMAGTGM